MSQSEGGIIWERPVIEPANDNAIDLSHMFAEAEREPRIILIAPEYDICAVTGWLITNGGYKEVYSPFALAR